MSPERKIRIQEKIIDDLRKENDILILQIKDLKEVINFERESVKKDIEYNEKKKIELEKTLDEYTELISELKELKREYDSSIKEVFKIKHDYLSDANKVQKEIVKYIKSMKR